MSARRVASTDAVRNVQQVAFAKLAQERWAAPLDLGRSLHDGKRLFGSHKTWRGLVSGVLAGVIAAGLMRVPLWIGAGFARARSSVMWYRAQ